MPTIWNDLSMFEPLGPPSTFLDVASQRHLASYVSKKILSRYPPALFHNERDRPLLDRIVTQCEAYPSFRELEFARDESLLPAMPSAALVRHLLASGTDPNEEVRHDGQGRTIWENVLGECVRAASMYRSYIDPKSVKLQIVPRLERWASIVEEFIRAGADPRMNRNSQQGSCIREAFGELLPQRANELERMLSRTRKRWSAINKFITPPGRRANVTPMDVTPFRLLEKRANASTPGPPWGEHFQNSGGERIESGAENRAPGFAVTRDSGDGYIPLDLRPPDVAARDPLLLRAGLRHTRPLPTQEATEQEHGDIFQRARRWRRLRRLRRSLEGRDPGDG